MKHSLLTALALSTFLTACTMAPDYEQPALPVAQTWPEESQTTSQPVPEAEKKAIAEIKWKDFFQSPSMQKVIQQSLDNNRDLRVAVLNIESARASYRIARADLLPTLNARVTETRTGIPANANFNGVSTGGRAFIVEQATANLSITSFELDLFGRVRSLNDAAYEQYLATQEARNAVQVSLIAETANAYLQWLADIKTLALVQDTLNAQLHSYKIIKASYDQGIRSKLELAQAQTTVETARANHAVYTRAVALDKNALMLLMGNSDPKALETTDTLDNVALLTALPVGLPSEVLLARPDIQQAEHLIKSQNANIGAARANFFPVISLTGSYGYSSTGLTELFKTGTGGAWSFAPAAVLPIFDTGRNLANLDTADVAKDTAVAQYEKSIQMAFREMSDALVTRKTLTDQRQAQISLVGATKSAYDLSDARYKSGIDNFLVVLDSQQALFTAQQNEIAVHALQLTNLVNLYKVMGGGA